MLNSKKINLDERILVAGANGMAGSAITKTLIEEGYGNKNLGGILFTPSKKEVDFLDQNKVKEWFKNNQPSIVIIAAAKVGGILANNNYPADFLLQNLKIQTNLIETAYEFKVKRLLFLGSSCIYPKLSPQPIKEDYLLTGDLEKTNEWYAIAKIAGIKLCQSLRLQYGFDAISLMPSNLYGPKDNYDINNSHVMASLIRKFCEANKTSSQKVICWGTGSPLREFMHVDDLGKAVLFALEYWDPNSKNAPKDKKGNPLCFLNVGTGIDISIKDLAEKIALLTGFKGEIVWDKSKPNGTPKKQLNIDHFKKMGWEAKISLNAGLKKTISEYLKNF